jgi:hypothetical protein
LIALAPQDVPEFPNEKPIDWTEFAVLNPVEVQVDDGELFSFDAFLEGSRSC